MLVLAAADNQFDNTQFTQLIEGNWWDAITGVFTQIGPIGESAFAVLYLLAPAMIYIKTENIVPASLLVLIAGIPLAVLFSTPIRFFFAIVAIFGGAVVLMGLVKRQ